MDRKANKSIRRRLDPAATRRAILRAAFKAFADKGFRGASIGGIAQAARVTKSLVQYHFGTKEQLWKACLEERAEPLLRAIDRFTSDESGSFEELVRMRFELLRDNPDVRRLLAWASMYPAPLPDALKQRRPALLAKLGADRRDPRFARMLFVLAAMDGWFLFGNLYKSLLGEEVADHQMEEEFLKLLQEVGPRDG